MTEMSWRCAISLLVFLLIETSVPGYLVENAVSLDKIADTADVIFKGTAVAAALGENKWFEPIYGFGDEETQFKVISTIKGEVLGKTLKFRHYAKLGSGEGPYAPQSYSFELGRTYVVFARRTDNAGVFQQIWMRHTGKYDEGTLLCANDRPVTAKTIKELFWSELMSMLQSGDWEDASYAIRQLDKMSGGGAGDLMSNSDSTLDYDRTTVLKALGSILSSPNDEIAQPALGVIGSHNPYMSPEMAEYWLNSVGSSEKTNLAQFDPKMKNLGGEMYSQKLVLMANGTAAEATRALAISALGFVRDPALKKPLEGWLIDPSSAVRSSATFLLTDFPDMATRDRVVALAADPVPAVRRAAALSIGFGQREGQADVLAKLLTDSDTKVRRAAAMSLLSFSPAYDSIAAIFKANIDNREFAPLFLLALARERPGDYPDDLVRIMQENPMPTDWSGGEIPAYAAQGILFKYLQTQPAGKVPAAKLDRYLDVLEDGALNSCGVPLYIYGLELRCGLKERAKQFRAAVKKKFSYFSEESFNQVDQDPALYESQ